eukprot:Gb_16220 [translate_table: standard]
MLSGYREIGQSRKSRPRVLSVEFSQGHRLDNFSKTKGPCDRNPECQDGHKVCLSIGDGANDVDMMQKANIGVGINDVKGQQATMAADFSIAQFQFLECLLLAEGPKKSMLYSWELALWLVNGIIQAFLPFSAILLSHSNSGLGFTMLLSGEKLQYGSYLFLLLGELRKTFWPAGEGTLGCGVWNYLEDVDPMEHVLHLKNWHSEVGAQVRSLGNREIGVQMLAFGTQILQTRQKHEIGLSRRPEVH